MWEVYQISIEIKLDLKPYVKGTLHKYETTFALKIVLTPLDNDFALEILNSTFYMLKKFANILHKIAKGTFRVVQICSKPENNFVFVYIHENH